MAPGRLVLLLFSATAVVVVSFSLLWQPVLLAVVMLRSFMFRLVIFIPPRQLDGRTVAWGGAWCFFIRSPPGSRAMLSGAPRGQFLL